jgi:hypothetical protein
MLGERLMLDISKLLEVKEASIHSYIFENPGMNLPRKHIWDIRINFKPVLANGITFDSHLSCQGLLEFDFKNWKMIKKQLLNYDTQPDSEWCYYSGEFDYINDINGEINFLEKNVFGIDLNFKLLIKDLFNEPIYINKSINVNAEYKGLIITPQNFRTIPKRVEECTAIAKEFVDLSLYQEEPEEIYRTSYLFRSRNE